MLKKEYKCLDKMGLYIHIPFCSSKCNYCDFNSFASKNHLVESYFKALLQEIEFVGENTGDCEIATLFIGGGTPSFVQARYIEQVLQAIRRFFTIAADAEITIEANPGTLTMEKLCVYRKNGVNRISIGLQAAQQHLLESLGRIHSLACFEKSYNLARLAGFNNINVDLIFGIPGQTIEDWKYTLDKVVSLEPEHISSYSLKIEEGTYFGDLYARNEIDYIDEVLERQMYYYANEYLGKNGYKHYEISNYAKPGNVCQHNMIYWKGEEYFGLGAGAHSYNSGIRYCNCCEIEKYIEAVNVKEGLIVDRTNISLDESINEYMMLGLRLVDGISNDDFKSRFGKDMFVMYGDKINKLSKKGLLKSDGKNIKLSTKGLDFANQVFMEFV